MHHPGLSVWSLHQIGVPGALKFDIRAAPRRQNAATTLPLGAPSGATNVKVASVADFATGQTITIDMGANLETAVIAAVGTGGATTNASATEAGTTVVPVAAGVAGGAGFSAGQTLSIDTGGNQETAVVASVAGGRGGASITVTAPLTHAHAAGTPISGSGITLSAALTKTHANGTQVSSEVPTPVRGTNTRESGQARTSSSIRPAISSTGCSGPGERSDEFLVFRIHGMPRKFRAADRHLNCRRTE
jgi:hypothetical protein